jgi:hypothetical protein
LPGPRSQYAETGLDQFHDDLIKNGSLSISAVEWILLDDPTAMQQAMK